MYRWLNKKTDIYVKVVILLTNTMTFLSGWRIVLKLASGGSLGTKSSMHALWTEAGSLNDDVTNATHMSTVTSYKSAIVDQWETTFIRAVSYR